MALSTIQQVLDRSIFHAILRVGIEYGYMVDRYAHDLTTNAGQASYKAALDAVAADKGFAIEIISHSNSQYKGNKKVARIVIDPYGFIPGEVGLDSSISYVPDGEGGFDTCVLPNQSSEYEVNVHLVGANANQMRTMNALLAKAMQRKGYIPRYPTTTIQPNGNLFYENTGGFDASDRSEGVIEKIYRFLFPEVYEVDPLISDAGIAAIADIELEIEVCEIAFGDVNVVAPNECAPVEIFDHLGNKVMDVPSGGEYHIPNPNEDLGDFTIYEADGITPYTTVTQGVGASWSNVPVTLRDHNSNLIKDDFDIGETYDLLPVTLYDHLSNPISTHAPGDDINLAPVIVRDVDLSTLAELAPGAVFTLSGGIVRNPDSSVVATLGDGEAYDIPNVNIYEDLDGMGTQGPLLAQGQPGENILIGPLGSTPSGIIYQDIYPSCNQQYRVGDPYWHVLNGTYDTINNLTPESIAALDRTAIQDDIRPGSPASGTLGTDGLYPTMLKNNNAFGNKYRFTDDQGNPSNVTVGSNIWAHVDFYNHNFITAGSTRGYVIDHLYNIGFMSHHALGPSGERGMGTSGGLNWEGWIDHAHLTYAIGGYTAGNSGWRLGAVEEYYTMFFGRHGMALSSTAHWALNLCKGNYNGSDSTRYSIITGTTYPNTITDFQVMYDSGNRTVATTLAKVTSTSFAHRICSFHPIRKHYT